MSATNQNIAFAQLTCRKTTTAQAIAAENDPINPSLSRGHKYDFVFYGKFVDHRRPYLTTATGFDSQWLFEDSVVSVHMKKLLDQPPESSDKWASLQKLRLAHGKFRRGMAGTAEAASDIQASAS
ncbi:hypothetical protein VMCG_08568 [Cytospora schulzeri]|uniref:Uncharacterized protein n=1 Tax=Cytospora schulzeri TaxID=448051 RepID=A0A423VW29_9PEZI|nr:hypothetical protein VMCG_08568 [Valsa malicola]